MNLRRAIWMLLWFSGTLSAFGQGTQPPPAAGTQGGRISGTVVHLTTGQPLPGIEVSISPTEQRDVTLQVVTGSDGHFAFNNLARGKYSLLARGRGFALQAYQRHGPYSTAVAVGPGLKSENLTFQLVPDASISGTVVDEADEPLRSGEVLLFSRDADGKMEIQSRGIFDELGHYHFGHLSPGTYFVAVAAQPWYAQDPPMSPKPLVSSTDGQTPADSVSLPPGSSAPSPLDVAYRTTYYSDATEPENATPIQLHPGERATADMILRAVPALHLTVRAAGSDPNQPGTVMIQQRLFDTVPTTIPVRSQQVAPGVLSVVGVPPGHFVLNVRNFTGKEWTNESREVDLSADTEIDATENTLGLVTIQGVVQVPGGAALPAGTFVRFFNRNTGETFGSQVSPKGTFEAQQSLASPTPFEVAVINVPDLTVQSIAATGATVMGRTLLLSRSGSVQLQIVLSKGLARIDGTVLHEDKPVAETMVVLIPEHPEGNADLFRRDQSDSDGTFSLYQVLPGRYTVIAIENGWDLDWQNPAVLQPYLEHGQSIEITAPRTFKVSVAAQDKTTASKPPQS